MKHYCYKKKVRGFTLIELVLTIVILGVLSATAMPKFFSYSVFQQTGFFYDMLNAIRYAQKLAVATNCNVQVAISANQYTLTRPSAQSYCTSTTSANFSQAVTRPGSGETSYQGSLAGVTLSSATFYFMAKGNASGAYTLTVGSHQISIVSDTGYVYGQ